MSEIAIINDDFEHVCHVDDIEAGDVISIQTTAGPIALFRTDSGCFATQEQCSHGAWSLADSIVDGDVVECPLHGGKFCLKTGSVKAFPPTIPLKTYPVIVQDGEVWVNVKQD